MAFSAYWIEGGEVWTADQNTGRVIWHGRPDGRSALSVAAIPSASDAIVLLHWMGGATSAVRNLIRCRPDGSVVWRAELPRPSDDFYTSVQWHGERLIGYTWSGHLCELDGDTGTMLALEFVK